MSLGHFLVMLLVAAIIGALGEAIGGFSPGGLAMSIVVGFIGAFVGTWLRHSLNMPEFIPVKVDGNEISVVWSVIGAALFVLVLRLVLGRRTYVVR